MGDSTPVFKYKFCVAINLKGKMRKSIKPREIRLIERMPDGIYPKTTPKEIIGALLFFAICVVFVAFAIWGISSDFGRGPYLTSTEEVNKYACKGSFVKEASVGGRSGSTIVVTCGDGTIESYDGGYH